jgi:hypothetical protein
MVSPTCGKLFVTAVDDTFALRLSAGAPRNASLRGGTDIFAFLLFSQRYEGFPTGVFKPKFLIFAD